MSVGETAELVARLRLKDEASAGINNAKGNLAGLNQAVDKTGSRMSRMGDTAKKMGNHIGNGVATAGRNLERLATTGGFALAGLGVAAAKVAIDWEDAFAGVRKTMTATEPEFKAMETGLLTMSSKVPIAATQLASLAEAAGALGVRKQDILEFTRVTALMGVTTNVTAEAAADAFGHIGTVIGLTGKQYSQFASSIVALGNAGASTEDQILGITTRIAGAAKTVGIAKDQLAGWGSAAANIGMQTEAAGSNLSTFFIQMFKNISAGGGSLKEVAKTAGMTADRFKQAFAKDSSGALEKFIEGLGRLKPAARLEVLDHLHLTGVRMNTLLLGLSSNTKNLRDSLELSQTSWAKNNAMQQEAEKRFKTTSSQLALLKNNLTLAGIYIGTELLPTIVDVAKEFTKWLQDNPEKIKQFGRDFAGLVKDAKEFITGLDWHAIGSGLQLAGTGAKAVMDAFMGAPDWLKAAVLSGWGLNKLTGGMVGNLFGDVFKGLSGGLAKGVMGQIPLLNKFTATPVTVMNWPMGGLGGGSGMPGATGGVMSKIGSAVSILGAVTIAGASVAALGVQFGTFVKGVADQQAELQNRADSAGKNTPAKVLSELQDFNKHLEGLNIFQQAGEDTVGGKQIVDALVNQSDTIANGTLATEKIPEAIDALKHAQANVYARNNKTMGDRIGADIAKLQRQLTTSVGGAKNATQALQRAIQSPISATAQWTKQFLNKPTNISVTVPVSTSVSVRDLETTTHTSSRYGFQAS